MEDTSIQINVAYLEFLDIFWTILLYVDIRTDDRK